MLPRSTALTDREWQVFELLASEGLSKREVAERLIITYDTVVTHVYNLRAKLGARNCVQALYLLLDSSSAGSTAVTSTSTRI